jgi:uncharacterized cupin superfamily protein
MERKPARTLRAKEIAEHRKGYRQRLNPASFFRGTELASLGGLARTGVSIAWLPPGQDSFAYHAHRYNEEWIYILSGRVVSEADGVETELGPGDFVAFPAPGVPHVLHNRSDAEVTYLMGGERRGPEVIDYPSLGKTYLLAASERNVDFYELAPPIQPFEESNE